MNIFDPVFSCGEARIFEAEIFGNRKDLESSAMERVGRACAREFLKEFGRLVPDSAKIIVLSGKGHNGGDAIWTARNVLEERPESSAVICIPDDARLKPNTLSALESLLHWAGKKRIIRVSPSEITRLRTNGEFDLMIEGIAGMNFTPPPRSDVENLIRDANRISARIKISMDMPAGISDSPPGYETFRADVSYATGMVKTPVLKSFNGPYCGRIRYIDVGFFDSKYECRDSGAEHKKLIVNPHALDFLNTLRPSVSDKRTYGHLFAICGSKTYPGAALLAVRAALRAGVGLVTAFVPESLAPQFAAVEPSAIWIGCPENESGAIALESLDLIRCKLSSARAILAGPGLTRSRETSVLLTEIFKLGPDIPLVLDADAIQPKLLDLLAVRPAESLVTPHEGEFLRFASGTTNESLVSACKKYGTAIALKGTLTRVSDGLDIVYNTRGSPVLARGGSGDIYAGICASLMANPHIRNLLSESNLPGSLKNPLPIACGACAAQWLGLAAERAFFDLGENAATTNDIAAYIPKVLNANP